MYFDEFCRKTRVDIDKECTMIQMFFLWIQMCKYHSIELEKFFISYYRAFLYAL